MNGITDLCVSKLKDVYTVDFSATLENKFTNTTGACGLLEKDILRFNICNKHDNARVTDIDKLCACVFGSFTGDEYGLAFIENLSQSGMTKQTIPIREIFNDIIFSGIGSHDVETGNDNFDILFCLKTKKINYFNKFRFINNCGEEIMTGNLFGVYNSNENTHEVTYRLTISDKNNAKFVIAKLKECSKD